MGDFPKFWVKIEEEFDANEGDLIQIKSVFTALGFMTQTSISSLKTQKKLCSLESEYMKMRSNTNSFEELCAKFPALKGIDSFTSGITATMMDVITHLNPKKVQAILLDEVTQREMLDTTRKTVLDQAKKVCNLSEDGIIFEKNGSVCKIQCPDCSSVSKLSMYLNNDTGKRTFSLYNFSRHYKETHTEGDDKSASTSENGDSSQSLKGVDNITELKQKLKESNELNEEWLMKAEEVAENHQKIITGKDDLITKAKSAVDDLEVKLRAMQESLKESQMGNSSQGVDNIAELERKLKESNELNQKLLDKAKEVTDNHQKIIAEKDALIIKNQSLVTELQGKLNIMRSQSLTTTKKIEQLKFTVNLCCFQKVTEPSINFKANEVTFTDCTNKKFKLYFNRIYNGSAAEEKFADLKEILNWFISGGVGCIVNHGSTGSGKSCTMFGANELKGLLVRSGEFILESSTFHVSAFEFTEKGCFDLIENKILLDEPIQSKKRYIRSLEDFERFSEHIKDNRTEKPTNQNANSSRSHMFIILSINDNSKMVFVDLAGFESLKEKVDSDETIYINKTLSDLNALLMNITKNNNFNPTKSNKMLTFLKPFLTQPNKTVIMYHMNNAEPKKGLEYIKDVASSSRELKRSALNDISNTSKIHRI